ncbi:very short patch repair endonuclease [Kocuria sp. CPCC 205263]|uniref:very short patch repair endonuclease n=1 Tax=Kocuria sp. CPCC 205263 TaxID=3073555 RepID=UPI0034D3EB1B
MNVDAVDGPAGLGDGHAKPAPASQRQTSKSILSSANASDRMSRQRRRDTAPELILRKELHRRGLRYRVDAKLPGIPRRRADLLFTRRKIAVFVDGCFWHACPLHATSPQNNADWWRAKLEGNVARDRDTDLRLRKLGWTVLRFWEHDDMSRAADTVEAQVRSQAPPGVVRDVFTDD